MAQYRLIQDDLPVAYVLADEASALREIMHYAAVYSQDGPVKVERKVNDEWWPVEFKDEPPRTGREKRRVNTQS